MRARAMDAESRGERCGVISELWRYPVKSMGGERCEALRVEERGAQGDRLYALRDAGGKLGSGKDSKRFRRMDGLIRFRAAYRGEVPWIEFPSGEAMPGDSLGIGRALSAALGQPVVFEREGAPSSHFDAAPIHVVTSASLRWLRTVLRDTGIDTPRFRPNLVVEVPGVDRVEEAWLGRRLRVGDELELQVSDTTKRCAMVTLEQDGLERAPAVLREIAQRADLAFGVYARVLRPGTVRLGDPVVVLDPAAG